MDSYVTTYRLQGGEIKVSPVPTVILVRLICTTLLWMKNLVHIDVLGILNLQDQCVSGFGKYLDGSSHSNARILWGKWRQPSDESTMVFEFVFFHWGPRPMAVGGNAAWRKIKNINIHVSVYMANLTAICIISGNVHNNTIVQFTYQQGREVGKSSS